MPESEHKVLVTREFKFCSAHQLPFHGGKCARLHGHNYRMAVGLLGYIHADEPNNAQSGMVVDFSEIKSALADIMDAIDHNSLNDLIFNPTAERLAEFMWLALKKRFGSLLYSIKIWETDDCSVEINVLTRSLGVH